MKQRLLFSDLFGARKDATFMIPVELWCLVKEKRRIQSVSETILMAAPYNSSIGNGSIAL